MPCGRAGAYTVRPHKRRPRRPCHYRAIHSSPDRSPGDNHGQHQGGLDLRRSPPSQVAILPDLALQAGGKADLQERPKFQWSALGPRGTGNRGFPAGMSGHGRSAEPTGQRTFIAPTCTGGEVRPWVRIPPPLRCSGPSWAVIAVGLLGRGQARALAFRRSNSAWSIVPASSSSLARAICSVGDAVASPVVATDRT